MTQGARRVERCDVAVVGGASAAFEAAVAARQLGAEKVVMLEKAPEPEFGGNARFSHTGFRVVMSGEAELREFLRTGVDEATLKRLHLPPYTAEEFTADLQRVTQGRINKELAKVLVDESNEAVHWMLDTGIKWTFSTAHREVDGKIYFDPGFILGPLGGGLGQVQMWRDIALKLGVELRYRSRVSAIHGNDQEVEGVRVSSPDGEYDLLADAVILCAGGFQASAEMRARYLGKNADLMKVRGTKHDTGEVLMAALGLGAAAAGHWQGAHATPVDATFPDWEVSNKGNRYGYMYGISVNMLGERFYDEGEAELSYTYAKTGWKVLGEDGGVAYQLFDQKVMSIVKTEYYLHATPIEAPTFGELATKIGIQPALLERTLQEYNQAVRDDIAYDPTRRDGKCTQGITPNKTNWALKLDTPPFVAYPVTCGATFSFGGLQINGNGQVMNTSREPIRRLYASGDIVGLFFHNYPAASGQTRNVVFSRLAAKHAVKSASAATV